MRTRAIGWSNELHERLIRAGARGHDPRADLAAVVRAAGAAPTPAAAWWRTRRPQLLALATRHDCAYVYDPQVIRAAARALQRLESIDRVLYAMKANPNAEILRLLAAAGLGFECVSRGRDRAPARERTRARPRPHPVHAEFRRARRICVGAGGRHPRSRIDNLYVLREWGELFRGRSVFIRIDTGTGRGHHHHVRTAGAHAKFGVPVAEIDELQQLTERHGVTVVGLHAHSGSGIFDADNWSEVATLLLDLAQRFPQLHAIDVGGGPRRARRARPAGAGSGAARYRAAGGAAASRRALRCGSSRAAIWWPTPACSSRA